MRSRPLVPPSQLFRANVGVFSAASLIPGREKTSMSSKAHLVAHRHFQIFPHSPSPPHRRVSLYYVSTSHISSDFNSQEHGSKSKFRKQRPCTKVIIPCTSVVRTEPSTVTQQRLNKRALLPTEEQSTLFNVDTNDGECKAIFELTCHDMLV